MTTEAKKWEPVTLENLGKGAAVERFKDELDKVLWNIFDPMTEARAKREINLKVVFLPNQDRDKTAIAIHCSSKLAPPVVFAGALTIGQSAKGAVAYDITEKQLTIAEIINREPKPENVEQLESRRPAAKGE